ncbi:plasminogen activator inhibitor 1-like [Plutella xylostella]|uniref:plasminogen activator inhibitor 1-like n=1 Tax=Plutella xylostella TaxID=51655 RepID=UPI002032B620|nr:plasminogen activator inhibitor 1-like [Plutella xylostella]XP_048480350.1 plasminogen activator inhibitor 1-like [Plutella xylostella]
MDWSIQIILVCGAICLTGSDPVPQVEETPPPLSHCINDFGYRLLLDLTTRSEGQNVVLGPTSVAGLLGMTLLGTVGDSYDEVAQTLGFSQEISANRQNHEQFGELLQGLEAGNSTSTLYADAIFVDASAQVREIYREYLQRVYHGDALTTDFTNQSLAKKAINEWVKAQTLGRIEEFVRNPLSRETRVVLLSALAFSGQWAQPFMPEYTKKLSFQKATGETVLTDLMLNQGRFNYILSEEHGCHMVALPYNDTTTTMYILAPRSFAKKKKMDLPTLLTGLNWTTIEHLISQMRNETTVIRLPKMQLKGHADLKSSLKNLGVKSIFEVGKANFALLIQGKSRLQANKSDELLTRINDPDEYEDDRMLKEQLNKLPNPGVYVDTVMHEVEMAIDEYGTEAVAVTAGIVARTANLFFADSPFLFFIKNELTGLVTFSSAIFDPTMAV